MELQTTLQFQFRVSCGILLLLTFSDASPISKNFPAPTTKPDPVVLENVNLNDDVNPDDNYIPCTTQDRNFSKLEGLSGRGDEKYRWSKTKGFTYTVDSSVDAAGNAIIDEAIRELRKIVCIPFNKLKTGSKPPGDYVRFQSSDSGCFSRGIGRQGRGKQIINLEKDGCMSKGIAMHEVIHALGFNHEQTRLDRDKYIKVFRNNIEKDNYSQYEKYAGSSTFGVPYDFQSIMHYGDRDFAIDTSKPTMAKINGGPIQKQRNALTRLDIQKLRKMYKC